MRGRHVGLFAGNKLSGAAGGRHQLVINGLTTKTGVKLDQFARYSTLLKTPIGK